jgi:hypothetical protein
MNSTTALVHLIVLSLPLGLISCGRVDDGDKDEKRTDGEGDEQGTEAGAATAIILGNGTAPEEPLTFNADHPFLFVIRERATDNILFMGKVADPTV